MALPVRENDEERMLRHKGDLLTTKTDTNNRSADGDDYVSQNPTKHQKKKKKHGKNNLCKKNNQRKKK